MKISKRICELVGIEPKKQKYLIRDGEKEILRGYNQSVLNDGRLSINFCDSTGANFFTYSQIPEWIREEELYPDLEQPENKCLAIEALRTVTGITFVKNSITIGIGFANTFEYALFDYIDQLSLGLNDYEVQFEKVKQALKSVEWEY